MKIEQVVPHEDKAHNAFGKERIRHAALEFHHVVVKGIVPLSEQFNDRTTLGVVDKEHLDKERFAADVVPIRMNDEVVHLVVGSVHRGALVEKKRTARIVRRDVSSAPSAVGLKRMHVRVN